MADNQEFFLFLKLFGKWCINCNTIYVWKCEFIANRHCYVELNIGGTQHLISKSNRLFKCDE